MLAIALTNTWLLVGLFALGWPPATIAFLFWFEAAMIGAVTLVEVTASLPGDVPASAKKSITYVRMPRPGERASASTSLPRVGGLAAPALFIAFYGALLAAYAALLLVSLRQPNYPELVASAVALGSVRLSMLLVVGGQMWAFWRDYVRGPAWQRTDPTFHFWKPFGLAFLTWIAAALGFGVLGWLRSPLVVLTVLIALKAVAELFHALIDAQMGQWQRVDDAFRAASS